MLITPRLNCFRVCKATDPDASASLTAAQIALLGITLDAGASGVVFYGPRAETVTRTIATPTTFPGATSITFARIAGPIDIPLAAAVSLFVASYAQAVEVPDPVTGKPIWQAGSIPGEVNIPSETALAYAGSGTANPTYPSVALLAGAWVLD